MNAEERIRELEIGFAELRTEFDSQSKLLKGAIILIAAHFGLDLSAVM
jgi:hypothetical protein